MSAVRKNSLVGGKAGAGAAKSPYAPPPQAQPSHNNKSPALPRKPVQSLEENNLLDLQGPAPAPATTYFQLVCQAVPERLVILREWPRKRLTQTYSQQVDPSQTKVGWEQFLKEKELDGKIRWVFGEKALEKLRNTIYDYDDDEEEEEQKKKQQQGKGIKK